MVAMVLLGSGVAYAANAYPEGKCSDPVDKDDSLLVEGCGSWARRTHEEEIWK